MISYLLFSSNGRRFDTKQPPYRILLKSVHTQDVGLMIAVIDNNDLNSLLIFLGCRKLARGRERLDLDPR